MSESWLIFIAGSIFSVVVLEIIIPVVKKLIFTKHPDTHIFLFRQTIPSENTYSLNVVAQNRGKGIDNKVKIKLALNPNNSAIESVKINSPERVKLIEGGRLSASFAVFYIAELLPDERQLIKVTTKGQDVESLQAWSKEKQDIKHVFGINVSLISVGHEEHR